MKRTVGTMVLATSAVLVTVPVFAADMAYKSAPAPMMRAVDSWSGFYIGGNVGYGVSRSQFNEAITFGPASATPGLVDTSSGQRSLSGVIGGGQIGYDWQAANWVFGIEADYQASDQKFNGTGSGVSSVGGTVVTQTLTTQSSLDWFGTVRGRLGYVVGNSLLYGTGGYAYGRLSSTENLTRGPNVVGAASFAGTGTVGGNNTGYVVGGGIETKLGGGWSTKAEYLYMDLSNLNNAYSAFTTTGGVIRTVASSTEFKDHIFRVGLNYKFGGY